MYTYFPLEKTCKRKKTLICAPQNLGILIFVEMPSRKYSRAAELNNSIKTNFLNFGRMKKGTLYSRARHRCRT
jgi:hypothetical protein